MSPRRTRASPGQAGGAHPGASHRRVVASEHQIVNEYRGAISSLNTGAPFMAAKADSVLGRSVMDFAKAVDKSQARSVPLLQPGSAR